jgi:hypothetical protein
VPCCGWSNGPNTHANWFIILSDSHHRRRLPQTATELVAVMIEAVAAAANCDDHLLHRSLLLPYEDWPSPARPAPIISSSPLPRCLRHAGEPPSPPAPGLRISICRPNQGLRGKKALLLSASAFMWFAYWTASSYY